MKQNVKRWFGILLGLTLMLGLMVGLSATAWADSNVASVTSSGTTTEYGTFSEALNAWTGGSTLKLLQNVTHTTAITVPVGEHTLDLNGHGILMTGNSNVFDIKNGATLTLNDSKDMHFLAPSHKSILL